MVETAGLSNQLETPYLSITSANPRSLKKKGNSKRHLVTMTILTIALSKCDTWEHIVIPCKSVPIFQAASSPAINMPIFGHVCVGSTGKKTACDSTWTLIIYLQNDSQGKGHPQDVAWQWSSALKLTNKKSPVVKMLVRPQRLVCMASKCNTAVCSMHHSSCWHKMHKIKQYWHSLQQNKIRDCTIRCIHCTDVCWSDQCHFVTSFSVHNTHPPCIKLCSVWKNKLISFAINSLTSKKVVFSKNAGNI